MDIMIFTLILGSVFASIKRFDVVYNGSLFSSHVVALFAALCKGFYVLRVCVVVVVVRG